jgi:hypothetical protein
MKQCGKCKETKELDEFHNNKARYDGKANYCKQCRHNYATSVEGRQQHRQYEIRYDNSDKGKQTRQKFNAVYARSNEGKATNKRYAQSDKGKASAKRATNKYVESGARVVYLEKWYSSGRGKQVNQQKARRRRALKKQLPSEQYSRCDIALRDGGMSWVTGNQVDAQDATNVHVDHLIPLAYYIPGHPGDVINNVALAEGSLNSGRQHRLTVEAWRRYGQQVVADVPDVSELGDLLELTAWRQRCRVVLCQGTGDYRWTNVATP